MILQGGGVKVENSYWKYLWFSLCLENEIKQCYLTFPAGRHIPMLSICSFLCPNPPPRWSKTNPFRKSRHAEPVLQFVVPSDPLNPHFFFFNLSLFKKDVQRNERNVKENRERDAFNSTPSPYQLILNSQSIYSFRSNPHQLPFNCSYSFLLLLHLFLPWRRKNTLFVYCWSKSGEGVDGEAEWWYRRIAIVTTPIRMSTSLILSRNHTL